MIMNSRQSLVVAVFVFAGAFGWTGAARAQQPGPPPSGGPLVLEPMHNGFLLAPALKFTKLDGKVEPLAGVYGGWIKDDRLFLGGGAYWRADRKRHNNDLHDSRTQSDLIYGGAVVGWFFNPNQPVSFSAKVLAGVGQFSQPVSIQVLYCAQLEERLCAAIPPVPGYHDDGRDGRFRFHREFFIVEPEFDVQARITSRIRLGAGAGYRLADRQRGFDRSMRAATGSVSVQFRLGR